MITSVVFDFATLLLLLGTAQRPPDYRSLIGQHKTVCGSIVTYTYPEKDGKGCAVRMDFVSPYWAPTFYAIVADASRPSFPFAPEASYYGQDICVSGDVKGDKARVPHIVVTHQQQIQVRSQQPPAPFGEGIHRVCEKGIKPPKVRREVKPVYPFGELVRDKKEDLLLLEAVVNADGSVGDIRTLYVRHREFEAAAHSALKQWQFRPATLNGLEIPVIVHVEMRFTLW